MVSGIDVGKEDACRSFSSTTICDHDELGGAITELGLVNNVDFVASAREL